jgi:hypothetical protein
MVKHKALVIKIKKDLMSSEESNHPFVKLLKQAPKAKWQEAPNVFEALSEAIRQLDAEGKLIDTL